MLSLTATALLHDRCVSVEPFYPTRLFHNRPASRKIEHQMKAVGDVGGVSEPVAHGISVRDTIEADGRNARMRGEPGRDASAVRTSSDMPTTRRRSRIGDNRPGVMLTLLARSVINPEGVREPKRGVRADHVSSLTVTILRTVRCPLNLCVRGVPEKIP